MLFRTFKTINGFKLFSIFLITEEKGFVANKKTFSSTTLGKS